MTTYSPVWSGPISLKIDRHGCALCGSTWGSVWEEVEGDRLFFCCSLCGLQFRNLVARIESTRQWDRVDSLEIAGDRMGRLVTAARGSEIVRYRVAFNPQGLLRQFQETP